LVCLVAGAVGPINLTEFHLPDRLRRTFWVRLPEVEAAGD
jgi:hypothetical protein